ncbi:MAG: hypothetical protein QOE31_3097 [Solirubrobacteraceae bacterium]|jgi:hypothetical protein|nr:hypothetical protein [Solirubrobacteraceae bacterium]
MPELALTRAPGDRRLYALADIGTLRMGGLFSRGATAEDGASSWRMERHGLLHATIDASDASGNVIGVFRRRSLRRGGTLTWAGRELELRPSSRWRERFALVEGERELAGIEGKSWGKQPVKLTLDDPGGLEPGLLLFAAFVVRALAEDTAAAAS